MYVMYVCVYIYIYMMCVYIYIYIYIYTTYTYTCTYLIVVIIISCIILITIILHDSSSEDRRLLLQTPRWKVEAALTVSTDIGGHQRADCVHCSRANCSSQPSYTHI